MKKGSRQENGFQRKQRNLYKIKKKIFREWKKKTKKVSCLIRLNGFSHRQLNGIVAMKPTTDNKWKKSNDKDAPLYDHKKWKTSMRWHIRESRRNRNNSNCPICSSIHFDMFCFGNGRENSIYRFYTRRISINARVNQQVFILSFLHSPVENKIARTNEIVKKSEKWN